MPKNESVRLAVNIIRSLILITVFIIFTLEALNLVDIAWWWYIGVLLISV